MGIIVRNTATNEITFYMKGADVIMTNIVRYNDWLDEEVSVLFSICCPCSIFYLLGLHPGHTLIVSVV